MCRLFGLLGNPGTPAEPWLLDTDRALIRQASASQEERQGDGWGIGWFTDRGAIRLEKGVGEASSPGEAGRFKAAARAAHGPLVVAHLRKASNPMHLPRDRLIGLENTQPFVEGTMVFAHNGSIPLPQETRRFLGPYESRVRGVNDSEVLFWLMVRHLDADPDPVTAFAAAVTDLVRVWREHRSRAAGPYTGLNVLFSRGPEELWAFCASLGEHGSGLMDRNHPYYEMAYAGDARHVIVGSEPFDGTRTDWRRLSNGQYLHAASTHGLVTTRTGAIPLPSPLAEGR